MKKKLITTVFLALTGISSVVYAQSEGEPIQAADEVPLGGFAGCSLAPPKNGCQARIKCYGVGNIFANTAMDVQLATKEATNKARSQLAMFYSTKQKAKEAIANASKSTMMTNADGSSSGSTEAQRMMASIDETSAEAVLSGVQVLGRQVDAKQRTVTVKIGVSCQSQAAAAQSQAGAARSANPGTGAPAPAAQPQSAQGQTLQQKNLKSFEQRRKGSDDF
ncbi:hypothetical protein AOB54_08540 [beta proteobacterium MWH-UniP1]